MIDTQIKREKCATKFCPNIGLASYFYSYHRHNPYIWQNHQVYENEIPKSIIKTVTVIKIKFKNMLPGNRYHTTINQSLHHTKGSGIGGTVGMTDTVNA